MTLQLGQSTWRPQESQNVWLTPWLFRLSGRCRWYIDLRGVPKKTGKYTKKKLGCELSNTWQFCWWPFWDGEFTWPFQGLTSNRFYIPFHQFSFCWLFSHTFFGGRFHSTKITVINLFVLFGSIEITWHPAKIHQDSAFFILHPSSWASIPRTSPEIPRTETHTLWEPARTIQKPTHPTVSTGKMFEVFRGAGFSSNFPWFSWRFLGSTARISVVETGTESHL